MRGHRRPDHVRPLLQERRDLAVEPAFQGVRLRPPGDLLRRHGLESGPAPVREDDVQRLHVVDRHPVPCRAGPAGVVPDHPSKRGPVGRGRIRGEEEAVRLDRPVQVVLNEAGLDPGEARLRVHVHDVRHVTGEVQHHGGPDGLPPEGSSPPPLGRIGASWRPAISTALATSSASRGKTTPIGSIAYMLASVEKRCRV